MPISRRRHFSLEPIAGSHQKVDRGRHRRNGRVDSHSLRYDATTDDAVRRLRAGPTSPLLFRQMQSAPATTQNRGRGACRRSHRESKRAPSPGKDAQRRLLPVELMRACLTRLSSIDDRRRKMRTSEMLDRDSHKSCDCRSENGRTSDFFRFLGILGVPLDDDARP